MLKIIKYLLLDIIKSKFINIYMVVLFLMGTGLFNLTDDAEKGIMAVNNISLILIPLVGMIFTITHIYNSTDFIRLLLTQPISRNLVFMCQFFATTIALVYAFVLGIGTSLLLFTDGAYALLILLNGTFLSIIFSSLSFLIATTIHEKVKGMGVSILVCIYFLALYDGILLILIQAMSDYPVEKYSIALALLNPVDLCRILMMFSMDISALMGITGAVLQMYLGTLLGRVLIYATLLLWALLPIWIARRKFSLKDF